MVTWGGGGVPFNQALVRSVPMEYKRSIMEHLKPIGFTGYKLDELTPNRTRRAQVHVVADSSSVA